MQDLSHMTTGLNNGESMSGGNTVAERPMRFGAPGSEPVDAYPEAYAYNNTAPVIPPSDDPAPIVSADGSKTSRPAQSGATDPSGFGAGAGRWRTV